MNRNRVLLAAISIACLVCTAAIAATEKPPKKLTCCEEAAAKGKECTHKCCVTAHNRRESCAKCNPGKEDLKLRKDAKGEKKPAGQKAP